MVSASPEGRALYQATFATMLEVMNHREGNGSPPDVAAVTIVRALTASRPRTVYLTGKDSRRLAVLSLLPTPVLDAAKRHVFGLPAPGSLTGSDNGEEERSCPESGLPAGRSLTGRHVVDAVRRSAKHALVKALKVRDS